MMERYQQRRYLGRGGMGEVWLGTRQLVDGRQQPVALKFVRSDLAGDREVLERCALEYDTGYKLQHEAIVKVHDWDMVDGRPCLILEYVDGVSLQTLIECGSIPIEAVRAILTQVLGGLRYLRQQGVLHRDIAPKNIMLSAAGAVKVVDLGLTRDLEVGSNNGLFKGTAAYAAPESIADSIWDWRTEMYALGATVYALLTRKPPYGDGNCAHIAEQMKAGPPQLPDDVPDDMRDFVHLALAPRSDRTEAAIEQALQRLDLTANAYASRDELGQLVAQVRTPSEGFRAQPATEKRPGPNPAPTPTRRPSPKRKRRPLLAALAVVVMAVVGIAWHGSIPENRTPPTVTVPHVTSTGEPAPIRSLRRAWTPAVTGPVQIELRRSQSPTRKPRTTTASKPRRARPAEAVVTPALPADDLQANTAEVIHDPVREIPE